jgi:glycogen operon protein
MIEKVGKGQSHPLGATLCAGGVNFSVFSKRGKAVDLLLFDAVDAPRPARAIPLDPLDGHRTCSYWHAFVPGIKVGQIYGYRVHGEFDPHQGLRFDSNRVLLDPYGRAVAVPAGYDREEIKHGDDTAAISMKSMVADASDYDWEDDMPPHRQFSKTVIYEMHVGGFTRHPNSGVADQKRGTYAGLIEKIPYLQDLGVTAVELLPVFQFDEQEAFPGLTNYWGYNPVSFFAPHVGYCTTRDPLDAMNEFRDMVKALHRAKIEVILDVVYNHTAEGNESGPTFCFKGFENLTYYILDRDKASYANYSGTGNSLNANHSVVRRLILDSLRYWAEQMRVDGFRFDLASVLARDPKGRPMVRPPILWDIETDPVLSGTKLIAEAWDAAGLYQVGSFFGDHWKEWNGKFRDDVRAFVKGNRGYAGKLASRFLASPDIYGHKGREPEQSINFVTCHDGFTLNDLVTYNEKHNLANKEQNRDGNNDNRSWNCGVEGPTDEPTVERLRKRQIKNFFTINLLAMGVPMILMGDEVRRTQQGNNNAYCQDNAISWFDWSLEKKHEDILEFVKRLIQFRQELPIPQERQGLPLVERIRRTDVRWHGIELGKPNWKDDSHTVAFSIQMTRQWLHMMFNAYWEALTFELPPLPGHGATHWQRVIDTYLDGPDDFCKPPTGPFVDGHEYQVQPRSIVLLMAEIAEVLD